jgi:hypothetical protein
MKTPILNEWKKFEYFDPLIVLPRLRKIREQLSESDIDHKIKSLRINKLKRERENWDVAVFCHLLSLTIGQKIFFSREESSDYDSIFTWADKEAQCFAPIQLKELVPAYTNPNANLQEIINKLSKYKDSNDLIVAIKLNRREKIDFSAIDTRSLSVRELWMFGATTESQTHWSLFGEIISRQVYQYEYELPYV